MQTLNTEILVIGGGATGTGVLRDLAQRGFKTILVDKSDLSHGTTGRYHGLLHSGGRYCVKDPQAAHECIQENTILRRIMPQCIEDTGGFFVVTPWDDPGYAERFVRGCNEAGIPVEELSISEMLRLEPLLDPRILRCFRVPDGSADSFLGAHLNVEAARQAGAQVLTYHRIERLQLSEGGLPRVTGAVCRSLVDGEEVLIQAEMVVNAAGAWAGQIAATAGVQIKIIPGKGTMLAMNHRIVNTVINRCRMPSDGDILVPAHTVSVIGTTDVKVTDPDQFAIEPWEVNLCLEEGDKLIPGFKNMRMLRAWAGVRPLYQESAVPSGAQLPENRSVTRAFVLLDHETRDGLPGLVTITSGKWTTYRKMAEVTVDLVCTKLGIERPCRTALEPLPDPHGLGAHHYLGARLADIEKEYEYGDLVCECELVTRQEVEEAIIQQQARSIDDVRRDVRLGMGPCQGGFCTYRAAGILHELASTGKLTTKSQPQVEQTDVALRDFLQERWKGLLPVLWGQQLRQERLDELIYLDVLNADHLPGPLSSPLSPQNYLPPDAGDQRNQPSQHPIHAGLSLPPEAPAPPPCDLLVVGAGFAGLAAAWQAAASGLKVRLISKGWGNTHWGSGCIDVLGYYPFDAAAPMESPLDGIQTLIREQPDHPYALLGIDSIQQAIAAFQALCARASYPMMGSLEKNWLLPSALGAARPTCLAPQSMVAGDMRSKSPVLVVGFDGYMDFYPHLVAANLSLQGIPSEAVLLTLESLRNRRFNTSRSIAEQFETFEFRAEVLAGLRTHLGKSARVAFPAVLGREHASAVHHELEKALGLPVFEIPVLPPSIPGIRLHRILIDAIESCGGRVFEGMQVVGADARSGQLVSVWTEAAARERQQPARRFILATGGILGGGIVTQYDGYAQEVVFNLPVSAPPNREDWLDRQFLSPHGHPIFRTGVSVNRHFQPRDPEGGLIYSNITIAGSTLAGFEPIRERSLEGVALATGYWTGVQARGSQ